MLYRIRVTTAPLFALAAATLMCVSGIAAAYEVARAKASFSDDLVYCAGYYQLSAINAKKMSRAEAESAFTNSMNFSLKTLMALRPEQTEASKIKADLDLALKAISDSVKTDGWSRVTLKYGDLCRQLLQDQNLRMQYWLDKKD